MKRLSEAAKRRAKAVKQQVKEALAKELEAVQPYHELGRLARREGATTGNPYSERDKVAHLNWIAGWEAEDDELSGVTYQI